jgi:hypothetical protein
MVQPPPCTTAIGPRKFDSGKSEESIYYSSILIFRYFEFFDRNRMEQFEISKRYTKIMQIEYSGYNGAILKS